MLNDITQPIAREMARFQEMFNLPFETDKDLLLSSILKHIHAQTGKQLRPIFTLLSARISGTVNDNTIRVAVGYETLHTASLVHDDVVDEAATRRGQASVNSLFGNKEAVLAGDYLLARAISCITATGDPELVNGLCRLSQTLSEGEFTQLSLAYTVPTEEQCLDIVRRKTAVLFTVSAEAASRTVGATEVQTRALNRFAEAMGICFQIKDDIFDYTPEAQIGKPTLNDIREGKVTLPLRHALSQIPVNEAKEILEEARRGNFTDIYFLDLVNLINRYDGITHALGIIDQYRREAISALDIFPESIYKQALVDLLDYVINRSK